MERRGRPERARDGPKETENPAMRYRPYRKMTGDMSAMNKKVPADPQMPIMGSNQTQRLVGLIDICCWS